MSLAGKHVLIGWTSMSWKQLIFVCMHMPSGETLVPPIIIDKIVSMNIVTKSQLLRYALFALCLNQNTLLRDYSYVRLKFY
jgi:hypothetical protein